MSRWVDRVISILHRKSPAGSHHPQRPPGHGLDRRSKTSILSPFSVQTIGERVGKQWQWGYGVAFLASLSPWSEAAPSQPLGPESALAGSGPLGFLAPAGVGKERVSTV